MTDSDPSTANDSRPQHTPAPWSMRDTHDNVSEITSPLFEDPYHCIASVNARWSWNGDGTDPIQIANARLIAAAPSLLDALKAVKAFDDHRITCTEQVCIERASLWGKQRELTVAALAAAQAPERTPS